MVKLNLIQREALAQNRLTGQTFKALERRGLAETTARGERRLTEAGRAEAQEIKSTNEKLAYTRRVLGW
jgi:Mn-dependent DtxR family transcriptional regulator